MATDTREIQNIKQAVKARFGDIPSKGTFNCRKIAGEDTWSQHAWANAHDYGWYGITRQRPLVEYLKTLPDVGLILWADNRPVDHTDHVHVEGKTVMSGVPPCADGKGGDSELRYANCERFYGGSWLCDVVDKTGKVVDKHTVGGNENPDGTPVGGGFLDNLNPFSGLNVGEIALQALWGLAGIAVLGIGAVVILVDTGLADKAAKFVPGVGKVAGMIR